MSNGWFLEPVEHGLAGRGISLGRKHSKKNNWKKLKTKSSKIYMVGLKGWKGYKKDELLNGKLRPTFGLVETYKTPEQAIKAHTIFRTSDTEKTYGVVPATKTNIKKQLTFNKKYASYSPETKQKIQIEGEKLLRN